jgi:hypothetical protein
VGNRKEYSWRQSVMNFNVFPALVYVRDKMLSGELTEEEVRLVLEKNLEAHGHTGEFYMPPDWEDGLEHAVNLSAWRIFEMPRLRAEQQRAKAEREAAKRAQREAKGQERTPKPRPQPEAPSVEEAPRRKVVIRKRKSSN